MQVEKDMHQAMYEFRVMLQLQQNASMKSPRRWGNLPVLHCPRYYAAECKMTGPSQWRVLGAMEKVDGEPIDAFTTAWERQYAFADACVLGRGLLEQLGPTFERVAEIAVHRDVNAHNILIDVQDGQARTAHFTLIDFGLAVDSRDWQRGEWKMHDIGGDCRYWPSSAWMQFVYGYKYLNDRPEYRDHYLTMLDVHCLALTVIQLLTLVMNPASSPHYATLFPVWNDYWKDATRFWSKLYDVFTKGGDWNSLKRQFMQQQVQETTERNVRRLQRVLRSVAADAGAADQASFFATLARMLDVDAIDWREVRAMLAAPPALEVVGVPQAAKRTHKRNVHSTDSSIWQNRNVPVLEARKALGHEEAPPRTEAPESPPAQRAQMPSAPRGSQTPSPIRTHTRIRSADYASQAVEYRMPYLDETARTGLRKISEANEADLDTSPTSPTGWRK